MAEGAQHYGLTVIEDTADALVFTPTLRAGRVLIVDPNDDAFEDFDWHVEHYQREGGNPDPVEVGARPDWLSASFSQQSVSGKREGRVVFTHDKAAAPSGIEYVKVQMHVRAGRQLTRQHFYYREKPIYSLQRVRDDVAADAASVRSVAPLARTAYVDAELTDAEPPAFGTLPEAVLYARGVVDQEGGTVLIRCYHRADGTPISADPRDHGIAQNPLDAHIRIVSPVFEVQKTELMLYGEVDHADLAGTIRHDDLAITIHTPSP